MKAILAFIRIWAQNKAENRMGWLQALNRIVCTGQRSSGSILFLAFPQELILKLAERTGGKPVRVQWMRPEDFQWSTQSPAAMSDVEIGLDANGKIAGYQIDHYMPAMQDDRPIVAVLAGQEPAEGLVDLGSVGSAGDVPGPARDAPQLPALGTARGHLSRARRAVRRRRAD